MAIFLYSLNSFSMGGPEAATDDAEAIQPNPFENANAGDRFYAASDSSFGCMLIVWEEHDPEAVISLGESIDDDSKGEIRYAKRSEVGFTWKDGPVAYKVGDTLEVLEEGLDMTTKVQVLTSKGVVEETVKIGDLRIKYTFKNTGESRIYVVPMDSLRKCDAQWQKDRRGPDNLMGLERARQLFHDEGPTRSTDKVSDGIRLGAWAQRVRSVLGRR